MIAFAGFDDHVAAMAEHAASLGLAARAAGLDAAVPTCPGWSIRDLLTHIGGVHRWASANLTHGAVPDDEADALFAAPAGSEIFLWYEEGHAALERTLRATPPDAECFTFLPHNGTPREFWARRQAHETAIHRVDAESARDTRPDLGPALAADGIDELLRGFVARRGGKLFRDPPAAIVVTPTDIDAAWRVWVGPDHREVTAMSARATEAMSGADLTIGGTATDLYLLLWNRGAGDSVTTSGDERLLDVWRDTVTVRWS